MMMTRHRCDAHTPPEGTPGVKSITSPTMHSYGASAC